MDVWLELHHNMYYESSISFVCERNEKFLILSMNVVMRCDFIDRDLKECGCEE